MRRWGVDCEVIYPPVDTHQQTRDKQNLILSVGRFTASGLSKKQLEMMTAFGELSNSLPSGWEYFSIGGVSDSIRDLEYFSRVKRLTSEYRAHALPNIERSGLKQLYEKARIFWHAAGHAEDDEHPELSEHFGIATVEAMSAGCIPVVIDKGGQTEIVEHGISGFLWNTLEELKKYTELLMRDEQLRARMEQAARARATLFSRDRFVSRFLSLLEESSESIAEPST
jgi:glycosyltransferase involved in cell wall biosynthesis